MGAGLYLLLILACIVFWIIWLFVMPFQIVALKHLMREMVVEQQRTNELLFSVRQESVDRVGSDLRAER